MTFEEVVLGWLREARHDGWSAPRPGNAVEVLSVKAYGTDWEGDTESGFHSMSDLTITYRTSAGEKATKEVSGEDMQSLWEHVMASWPKEQQR